MSEDDFGWSGPAPKGLVGHDFARFADAVGRKLEAEAQSLDGRAREMAELQRDIPSRTYLVRVTHIIGRAGDPVEVETIDQLPVVGRARATGRTYEHCLANLWYGIANTLRDRGYSDDFDECRQVAVERYTFLPSHSDGRIIR